MKKEDLNQLSHLAWKAAQVKQIHPTQILIRSGPHDTTMGKPDPDGMQYTICFMDRNTEAERPIMPTTPTCPKRARTSS
ncbi:hypothetical protein LA080_009724 [Diaporthe eres]|nr:hypothetical protein LA080_009724 [Diaporthe eres]